VQQQNYGGLLIMNRIRFRNLFLLSVLIPLIFIAFYACEKTQEPSITKEMIEKLTGRIDQLTNRVDELSEQIKQPGGLPTGRTSFRA
jgi:hypothetical protein